MLDDAVVCVAAINSAGRIVTCTSCDAKDAFKYAKYYRSIRENGIRKYKTVKIFTYDELPLYNEKLEKETKEAMSFGY